MRAAFTSVVLEYGHFGSNGGFRLRMTAGDGSSVVLGGRFDSGTLARSVRISNFYIIGHNASQVGVAHDQSKNTFGPSLIMMVLRAMADNLKTHRPGIQTLEVDFTRVTGARGQERVHRTIAYDISGDRPRLHDHETVDPEAV